MRSKNSGRYANLLHLAVVVLAVLVLLVSRENRRLEAELADARTRASDLDPGRHLPEFAVEDLGGVSSLLSLAPASSGAEGSVLLIFDPACDACADNLPRWRELYERVGSDRRVVGVSLEGAGATRAFVETHELDFPVVMPRDPRAFARAYGVTQVPMTLVADRDGRVVDARVGVLPRTFGLDLGG